MKLCVCGHKKLSHRYLALIGENSGECLARDCNPRCEIYEEKD